MLADLRQLPFEDLQPSLRAFVGLLAQRLPFDLELDAPALELVELDRHRIDLHPQPAGRLVDQVDRLVRQEAIADVAVRKRGRGYQRGVGDADAVVDLVLLAQAAQDRDRLLDRRLVHDHGLEAPLQGGVLLDVLAVLVQRRGADGVQLAAGQHRLEQVGGVHRAFGRAGADDGVQLVDEQDDPALGLLDLAQDGLEALLELAAELGPGDQRAKVQRDDLLVLEGLGHVAADDALGQALHDRGLADAGLADQDRVVLGAARQDLDDAADLLVAADDRIQLAGPSLGREVAPVLLQGLVGGLGVRACHALAAPDADQCLENRFPVRPVAVEQRLGLAAALGDGEEQVLRGDVVVLEPFGLVRGPLDGVADARVGAERTALDLGPLVQGRGQLPAEGGHVHAEAPQRLGRDAVVGLDERGEEMLRIEHGALELLGQALGRDDGLLGLLGEAIEIHCVSLSSVAARPADAGVGFCGPRSRTFRCARFASSSPPWPRHGGTATRGRSCPGSWVGLNDLPKELLGGLTLLALQLARQDDFDPGVEVARALALETRHALAGQPEGLALLGPGRDRQHDAAAKGLHLRLATEQRLAEGDRQLASQVRAGSREDRVGPYLGDQVQVSGVRARAGLAAETDLAARLHAALAP